MPLCLLAVPVLRSLACSPLLTLQFEVFEGEIHLTLMCPLSFSIFLFSAFLSSISPAWHPLLFQFEVDILQKAFLTALTEGGGRFVFKPVSPAYL